MNYINKGKRDILLLPKFENIDKIQQIRKQYDDLADILPPHITLAFPFDLDISNDKLHEKLTKVLSSYKRFKVKLKGISYCEDYKINETFIFLDMIKGQDSILSIHKDIYEKVLNINLPEKYIPHITLGVVKNSSNVILEDSFETTIDKVYVESIGENEESNIEFNIDLR